MSAGQRRNSTFAVGKVDDAHLLKTDWKGGRDVLDHVKHINTELGEIGATLILIGANLEDGDLVNDPQIAGRLDLQKFPRYGIDTVAEMRTWQGIVRRLEILVLDHLPAGKPGMLYLQLPGELWHRTQGYLGDLTHLVSQATLAARNDGAHRILPRHLNKVKLSERAENERRGLEQPAGIQSPKGGDRRQRRAPARPRSSTWDQSDRSKELVSVEDAVP